MITESARAKVNLTLHVTGQREDGYHLLHSLVVFPDIFDRLTFEAADEISLALEGPRAGDLATDMKELDLKSNLVLCAAKDLQQAFGVTQGARIVLEKNLPTAAGIGGGSADAAAALRGLLKLWSLQPDEVKLVDIALGLGADVPVCLASCSALMSGIGEVVQPVQDLVPHWLVLANCGRPVPTGSVFRDLDISAGSEASHQAPEGLSSFSGLTEYLGSARNDLQKPAIALEPEIQQCLDALRACDQIALARMSGSGATCFGLFEQEADARAARHALASLHPDWWVYAGKVD